MPHRSLLTVALRVLIVSALLCGAARAQTGADCPPTAQVPTPEQIRAGMAAARDHGFLWRIAKDGRTSWLFGTVHVARPEWMYPGPALKRALDASDTIALELDVLDPEVQQRMARAMAAPADAPPLPEALRERVQRRAAAECLPQQALAGLGPEMQIASLASLAGRRVGLDPAYGIDVFLSGWGHAANKAVASLETPELQLQALRMGSADEAIEFVESALDEMESGRAGPALARVAQVWADADLGALARYESWCECMKTAADRAAMARMLDERNPALADGIAALHASGKRVFAAVGSLHMIGATGLPTLLAQRGFRVERVSGKR